MLLNSVCLPIAAKWLWVATLGWAIPWWFRKALGEEHRVVKPAQASLFHCLTVVDSIPQTRAISPKVGHQSGRELRQRSCRVLAVGEKGNQSRSDEVISHVFPTNNRNDKFTTSNAPRCLIWEKVRIVFANVCTTAYCGGPITNRCVCVAVQSGFQGGRATSPKTPRVPPKKISVDICYRNIGIFGVGPVEVVNDRGPNDAKRRIGRCRWLPLDSHYRSQLGRNRGSIATEKYYRRRAMPWDIRAQQYR